MKKLVKFISLLLTLVLTMTMFACSDKGGSDDDEDEATPVKELYTVAKTFAEAGFWIELCEGEIAGQEIENATALLYADLENDNNDWIMIAWFESTTHAKQFAETDDDFVRDGKRVYEGSANAIALLLGEKPNFDNNNNDDNTQQPGGSDQEDDETEESNPNS